MSNIKNKLTPKQLHMFKKKNFDHFLDVKLVFNGPLYHYILLREVEEERVPVDLCRGQRWHVSPSHYRFLYFNINFEVSDYNIYILNNVLYRAVELVDNK